VRGCLFVLVLAAAVLGAGAWFGSPAVASALIQTALEGGGYHASTSTVRATSDPPPKLLTGRVDRVQIAGTDVDFRTFHAASLDLVLTDVDLFARTAGGVSGRIDAAEMKTADGVTALADVSIEGTGSAAAATITVGRGVVEQVARETFEREFGVTVTAIALVEPDILRISSDRTTVEGKLEIDAAGSIALRTLLGSTTILTFDPSFPLRLVDVGVAGGDLRIDATLDTEALLGG
jgi:hypothetical protein